MQLLTVLIVVLGRVGAFSQDASTGALSRVDHLIYATPDLERTVEEFQHRLGVKATLGGSSPDRGTHNALIALGPATYLEIVAPDPRQQNPPHPPWWLHGLKKPHLVQWAVKGTDLEHVHEMAVQRGVPLGEVLSGSRQRPDGVLLTWRFTSPRQPVAEGIVPFFIDWGLSPHPATSSVQGVQLIALRAEHPDHRRVQGMLHQLGIDLAVTRGSRPALIATIEGPRGRLELR
jgi:hypothetical protein